MLLTITNTLPPSTDLSYLLHKNPDKFQSFELSFGQAHVFYPQCQAAATTVALLLDVDPVGLVRGKSREQSFLLGQYVNDRPYVASSLLSVAISQVFSSAMQGRCKERPELVTKALPLTASIEVLPVRGGEDFLQRLFAPLGYTVTATRHTLDENFPEWGESPYYSVTLTGNTTLANLLTHLYVLIPVFDNSKHYYVGDAELEKLLEKGGAWLAEHPEKEVITRRYLRNRPNLYREALARLAEAEPEAVDEEVAAKDQAEESLERAISLNDQRYDAVLSALRASGAKSVLDLGCSEGKFLRQLLDNRQFERIVGVDVSMQVLQRAAKRLNLDRLPAMKRERIELMQGSLTYRDQRLHGFDAAAVIEVIEHLDPPRLAAFERVLFEFAQPRTIILTTPNSEYNVRWKTLPAGKFRHGDHRFEWTRVEFQTWAERVAAQFGYAVNYTAIGDVDPEVGAPTQMGVFTRLRADHG
jgi:3' terminal RNA ribose 2'-O-methyltransferase Hen1